VGVGIRGATSNTHTHKCSMHIRLEYVNLIARVAHAECRKYVTHLEIHFMHEIRKMEKCKIENSFESSSGQQSQLITQLEFQK